MPVQAVSSAFPRQFSNTSPTNGCLFVKRVPSVRGRESAGRAAGPVHGLQNEAPSPHVPKRRATTSSLMVS